MLPVKKHYFFKFWFQVFPHLVSRSKITLYITCHHTCLTRLVYDMVGQYNSFVKSRFTQSLRWPLRCQCVHPALKYLAYIFSIVDVDFCTIWEVMFTLVKLNGIQQNVVWTTTKLKDKAISISCLNNLKRYSVRSFHGEIVPSQIIPWYSQIVPQKVRSFHNIVSSFQL